MYVALKSNIDTTTGADLDKAKVISTSYTFTNFELARGTVNFTKGFTVPSAGTAFVGVNLPVGGVINLNSGTLVMQSDMYLASGASIIGDGTIVGNNHVMYLGSDLTISSHITFSLPTQDNHFNLDGRGNRLIFSAVNTSSVGFDMGTDVSPFNTFMGFSNLSILNAIGLEFVYPLSNGNTTTFTLKNVEFSIPNVPNSSLGLWGTKIIQGDVRFVGNNSRLLFLNQGMTIEDNSMLYVGPSINCELDLGDPNNDGIHFAGKNSLLFLDNCNLIRDKFGAGTSWTLTKGKMIINGYVNLVVDPGQQAMTIGDGISADNDFDIDILPGSTLAVGNIKNPLTFSGSGTVPRGLITYQNIF